MISHTQAKDASFLDYVLFSLTLGLRSLRPRFYRDPLARIINPLSYVRGTEFKLVFKDVCPGSTDRVLDIGSPKLPFLYLAASSEATLHATDVRPYFIEPARQFLSALGKGHLIGDRLFLETQDARSLSYPDRFFEKVFSISVLEHIPDNGDSQAMTEIARVLKPGGIACLTVPFSSTVYSEEFRHADVYERRRNGANQLFYQRRYDPGTMTARLLEPSGLRTRSIAYFGEPYLSFDPYWSRIPLAWKIPLLWCQPLLERILVRVLSPAQRHHAVGVAITLEKKP